MRRSVLIGFLVVAALTGPFAVPAEASSELTVTPNTNLVSGQTVNVSGTGWEPATTFIVQQCLVRSITDLDCLAPIHITTDSSGSFSTPFVVQRFFNGSEDCNRAPRCLIGVSKEDLTGATAAVFISFIEDTARPDLLIRRRSDGALLTDNSYTPAPTLHQHFIAPGGAWTFATVLQNDGAAAGDLTVTATAVAAPFSVRYFFGYYDITSLITGPGITFHDVAPGRSYGIAVQFRANATTSAGATADITMTATSVLEPGLNDVLKLGVTSRQ